MLTNVEIRALKPAARPLKVPDGDGLYLLVQSSGALLWRFRYKVFGVERKLSLGSFPNPTHPDHAEIPEWLDGYDLEELEIFPIEVALGRIAARRNAAAKRIAKPAND